MTKVISISDEAYNDLRALKTESESFSEIIKKITGDTKRKRLMELTGAWKDDNEIESIFKKIIADRQKTKARKADF